MKFSKKKSFFSTCKTSDLGYIKSIYARIGEIQLSWCIWAPFGGFLAVRNHWKNIFYSVILRKTHCMHTRCVSDVGDIIPRVDSTCGKSFPPSLWGILTVFGFFEFFFIWCHFCPAANGAENVSMLGLILKF